MQVKQLKNVVPYLIAIILCLCAALPVFSKSIVLDEAHSVLLVRENVQGIIHGTAIDVHPPLYYLILKLAAVIAGGESLALYRAVTVFATCLNLIILGATVIRKRWGNKVAVIYILWFGTAYSTAELSVFIRMYSWGAFWVTAAALALIFYYERERIGYLAAGVLLTLAAMYTHYYAVITVFLIWLFLLATIIIHKRKLIWHVVIGGVSIVLGYLPWLVVWYGQSKKVANNFWMTEFDWGNWFMAPANLMASSLKGMEIILYFLAFVLLAAACLNKNWKAILALAGFVGTMIAGALVSVLITPMWADRYLYVAWGMLSLFIALSAGMLPGMFSRIPQTLLCIILGVSGVFSVQQTLSGETMTSTADGWVSFIEENVDSNAGLIVDDIGEHRGIYLFYMSDAEIVMTQDVKEESLLEMISSESERQVWYIANYSQLLYGVERMEAFLNEHGYDMYAEANYTLRGKNLEIFRIERKTNEKI